MRVTVDYGLCEGHAQCNAYAPELFGLDEASGKVVLLRGDEIPAELRDQAREAADMCPLVALRVVG